jgi:hypothetical protein
LHSLCLPAIAYLERCIGIRGFWRGFKNHNPELGNQAQHRMNLHPYNALRCISEGFSDCGSNWSAEITYFVNHTSSLPLRLTSSPFSCHHRSASARTANGRDRLQTRRIYSQRARIIVPAPCPVLTMLRSTSYPGNSERWLARTIGNRRRTS